jgi:dihydrofolate synthase/folylpolyglutamate synthase
MDRYDEILSALFVRFPSVSKAGFSADAYKPGLEHMYAFDARLGHPSEALKTIHVAGTNGKGSVSSMLASVLAARGLRVGLFTSPHLLDFRERIKIVEPDGFRMIAREDVLSFVDRWNAVFDELSLSFFEITTGMAFDWFVREEVEIAVIEVGLGGRLDSTNILVPELSLVTSIGLDHCAQLGSTRSAIAGEKAGIFKAGVPALVGERDSETAPVFESAAASAPCPLFFAEDLVPLDDGPVTGRPAGICGAVEGCELWTAFPRRGKNLRSPKFTAFDHLSVPDLRGEYQWKNLRTVLAALDLLGIEPDWDALAHTAARTGLRGRWETLQLKPLTVCDIGHNPPALRENFAQLRAMMDSGRYDRLLIVYGIMADKALDDIIPLMPRDAEYCFVTPNTPRALPAAQIAARFPKGADICGSVADGIRQAEKNATENSLIYIGGSTFVVSEAITYFETK